MQGTLSLVTAPTVEPISLDEAKLHLRIDGSERDTEISAFIAAARGCVESRTRRQLVSATWDMLLGNFPCRELELRPAPVRSVTYVKYLDGDGTLQTLASSVYRVIAPAGPRAAPGRLTLGYSQTWPVVYPVDAPITVRVVAGYSDPVETDEAVIRASVPQELRSAMLLIIGELNLRRETAISGTIITEVPLAASALMSPFVITRW